MSEDTIRVLLIGETEHGCSHVRRLLEKRGCSCWFGKSFDEGAELFDRHSFHMVLSTVPFHQHDQFLVRLRQLPSTVFQCFRRGWLLVAARRTKRRGVSGCASAASE